MDPSSSTSVVLKTISGRKYRTVKPTPPAGARYASSSSSALVAESKGAAMEEEALEEHDLPIRFSDELGAYTLQMEVAPAFYGFLIGRGGSTLATLRQDTGCTIKVPSRKSKSTSVDISGPTEANVLSAKTRIDIIVAEAQSKVPYTHFLSIPLPQLQQTFNGFKEQVLDSVGPNSGIEDSVFIAPTRLHLTCCMLKLLLPKQVHKAAEVVRELAPKVYDAVGTTTVTLPLRGLEIMTDDTKQAHVVYVKPLPSPGLDKIKEVVGMLIRALNKAGLLDSDEIDQQQLIDAKSGQVTQKFHLTVLNSKYRNTATAVKTKGRHPKRVAFDASGLLRDFGTVDFGVTRVESIRLSDRMSSDADGYYRTVAKIGLP